MPSDLIAEEPRRVRRGCFEESVLQRTGLNLEAGAPATGAKLVGAYVVASFGDGTLRFFHSEEPPITVQAHRGAILCLSSDNGTDNVLTGGDDGRFLRVSPEGTIDEIASFGSRWVDSVAAGQGWRACSSGNVAYLWGAEDMDPISFEHPSTVGGLAFDAKATRLAVSHYGGATVWERRKRGWRAKKLIWKGSHGELSFSPNGKFLVTAMQENALHGWRLRDKVDMRMSGYPAKVKSFAWVGDEPYLATSGANEAICWPFDGKDGPLGREPLTCAYGGKQICTVVAGFPGIPGVFAGFADGAVLAEQLTSEPTGMVIKGSSGSAVTALAISPKGWVLVGEGSGRVLWCQLAGDVE
ncbi:MAG: hypothetical protein CBB68_12715 [Rhodospirillaceae bacterium TMED8]|nr:hypothetical protein [Magnetovibrio sp.]OUT48971.1 MAG: hypothetical protein CBB68_12715 [Rhodospirillaceae bacterium TMED8]